MTVIGQLDLSTTPELYKAIKTKKQNRKNPNYKERRACENYIILDDNHKTVWVNWYEGIK